MVKAKRGQLILVAAVLVSLVVVSTVVLLNSVHAPSDIQTDTVAEATSETESITATIHRDLERLFRHNTSVEEFGHPLPFVRVGDEAQFRRAVEASYEPLQARMIARSGGGVVNVTYDSPNSITGAAVFQLDNSTFEPVPPDPDDRWTVFTTTSGVTRIEMNVTDRSPNNATLIVSDVPPTTEWHLNISEDNIFTTDRGELCNTGEISDFANAWIHVDVKRGRGRVEVVSDDGTTVCDTFEVGTNLPDPPWRVQFEHGDRIEGNYTITAPGTIMAGNVNTNPAANPNTYPQGIDNAIINPAFEINYTSDSITYHSEYNLYNQTSP